ncbi:DUF1592 domain-containing protein [Pseudomonas sp. UMAB-08]|uniref:DUF1592 domain-containing protein n=1 Tax=Pseudomonas sp. UMAB-08 TaxID=1365375 RepID=UPI001C57C46F|nr:DUF1592 domain-containing protein [Pseudomonas sp. UMAB-08]
MPLPPLVRLLPYIVFVILIATLYYIFPSFAYANSPAPGTTYSRTVNTPVRGKAACTSPQYAASTPYTADFIVQNKGWEYKCKNDAEGGIGSWQWCSQAPYEPGLSTNTWKDAWVELSECGATAPHGNSLKLTFDTLTKILPSRQLTKGVGKSDQKIVTGTLRCKDESLPISGNSGAPLEITGLKRCDYQLVMDTSEGYAPLNTPKIIKFSEEDGQHQDINVVYRRPVDVGQLSTLPGYNVELFAQGMIQPRQMAMGKNVLYVGSSAIPSYIYDGGTADFIYALPLDAAGKPTGLYVIASGLEEPHGVAYRDGDLFYSTTGGLYRIRNVDATFKDAKPELVLNFPADSVAFPLPPTDTGSRTRFWHQKHPLHFNPVTPTDRGLYTAVGIPCNVCMIPAEKRYGTVLRYDIDTGESTIMASGVRNSVGFDWNPVSKEIWFSDNNRQNIVNSDELNRVSAPNERFGVPYIFGKNTLGFTQQEFDNPGEHFNPPLIAGAIVSDLAPAQIDAKNYQPAAFEFGMSMAPLGVKYWDPVPPKDGAQQLLVATHGTGTVAVPGMDVRRMGIKAGKVVYQIPLINGWVKTPEKFDVYCLTDDCIGRPTDFLLLPDNSLLISDDVAGVIYRVTYDASSLKKTNLVFHSGTPPPATLADEMISGYLIDASGNSRLFNVGWGSGVMTLEGLDYGSYEVHLNDVKHWVPSHRNATYVLSEKAPNQVVDMSYKERDESVTAQVTFIAPAKPVSVSAANWAVELVDASTTASRVIQVPWGDRVTETLKYGQYQARYPYFTQVLPEPTLGAIDINESSTDFDMAPVTYRSVENLGSTVIAEKCSKCHSTDYFQNASMAHSWSNATHDNFVQWIRGMKITGHCDQRCGEQVADHLLNTVWAPYLNPAESVGTRQLRLLTRSEYVNTIKDIFTLDINPGKLPADKSDSTFKYPGEADLGIVEAEDAKLFYDMAISIANQAPPQRLEPFKKANAKTAVMTLGHQLFRRPLTVPETERYTQLLNDQGTQGLITGMLLSPYYLYRSELGIEVEGEPDVYRLTANELATALSYAFLGTTPSDALMTKAEAGRLNTPEQIGAEVDAMMLTPRGLDHFNRFIQYYTKTARELQEKPGLTPALIEDMRTEQRLFVEYVIKEGNGTLDQLFNPGFTFLNQPLAEHYGITGVSGADMVKVSVDAKRGGLLHQGVTQVATSDYAATSLVKRGIMVREQMFCKEFGAPVEADPSEPAFPDRAITTRERWDLVNGEHASSGNCWKCHQYMNDTGGAMENYDASGRYRQQENAYNYTVFPQVLPIYAGGPFIDNTGSHTLADVNDVRDIAALIPHNPDAQRCMADSYFRFTFGSQAQAHTAGIINALSKGLAATGSLRDMMRTVATSHAFLYKQSPDARKQP